MKTKKKKTEVVEKNDFFCDSCKSDAMSVDQLKTHLKEKHGITDTNGTRKMLMHTDGADWFGYQYEWTIGGLKFLQSLVQKRDEESRMYWQ